MLRRQTRRQWRRQSRSLPDASRHSLHTRRHLRGRGVREGRARGLWSAAASDSMRWGRDRFPAWARTRGGVFFVLAGKALPASDAGEPRHAGGPGGRQAQPQPGRDLAGEGRRGLRWRRPHLARDTASSIAKAPTRASRGTADTERAGGRGETSRSAAGVKRTGARLGTLRDEAPAAACTCAVGAASAGRDAAVGAMPSTCWRARAASSVPPKPPRRNASVTSSGRTRDATSLATAASAARRSAGVRRTGASPPRLAERAGWLACAALVQLGAAAAAVAAAVLAAPPPPAGASSPGGRGGSAARGAGLGSSGACPSRPSRNATTAAMSASRCDRILDSSWAMAS